MVQLLENALPIVESDGLNSNKAAVMGGAWTMNGAVTFGGALTVAGATIFNGSVTMNGSKVGGSKNVLTAAASLTAAQSTSLCVFSTAAGQLYTLPAPAVGLSFDFFVQTTATSLSHKVITNTGTVFLLGAISYGILDTTPGANPGPKFTAADGSSMVSIAMNGTTTGGVAGTYFTVTCISATLWAISGLVIASGTISTPFATS